MIVVAYEYIFLPIYIFFYEDNIIFLQKKNAYCLHLAEKAKRNNMCWYTVREGRIYRGN